MCLTSALVYCMFGSITRMTKLLKKQRLSSNRLHFFYFIALHLTFLKAKTCFVAPEETGIFFFPDLSIKVLDCSGMCEKLQKSCFIVNWYEDIIGAKLLNACDSEMCSCR